MVKATASMCSFGSCYRKFFTLMASAELSESIIQLSTRLCPGTGAHRRHPPARGYDAWGRSRAAQAGRYPPELYRWLLRTVWGACESSKHSLGPHFGPPIEDISEAGSETEGTTTSEEASTRRGEGGRVSDGPSLHPAVRRRVEAARETPAGFASLRNRFPAGDDELMRSPLPDVVAMARHLAPQEPYTVPKDRFQWDGIGDWRDLVDGAPQHAVSLADIVGDTRIAAWLDYLQGCQEAFDNLATSKPVISPGEFTIRQTDLPHWAQPFVWDCENPRDCSPVLRSSRDTVFAGEKQVDRAALRRVAIRLRWDEVDPDIVSQVCEGGAELRSEAPRHTTACWHHPGLMEHFATADAVVREERAQLWTRVSSSPLPFVPCVFSPRNVVLQERSRLLEDGTLELYMKPRVTHDMSAVPKALGGRRRGPSINSGVPAAEKGLQGMPTVQSYARAQAIASLAT